MASEKLAKAQSVVIDVRDVKKKFHIYYDRGPTLKERVLFRSRRTYTEHWVLNGISFQIRKGEAVGLIGENGCGKSTTLKLLTKILYPDEGSIAMHGRVSSLIELGAGFHPDMTGRENIYTNASIFGLKRDEIDARLQTIIDFSELGSYIDNPVRTYSSGMYMRLAFAVAINVDADILLIDEILAVGDAAFQAKCFNHMREVKRSGTTIVIVSHSLGQVEQICDRSIWIKDGLLCAEGKPMDVHQRYLQFMSERSGVLSQDELPEVSQGQEKAGQTAEEDDADASSPSENRRGSRDVYFEEIKLLDSDERPTRHLQSGRPFWIVMDYCVNRFVDDAIVGIGIFRNDGLQCYGTNTAIDRVPVKLRQEKGTIRVEVQTNGLLEGEYLLDVALHRPDGFDYDYYRECLRFTVGSAIKDVGVARLPHMWHFA